MNNTKTLIQSSIISLIIVILGLFTLCISRAPRINIDEPLIEGGGFEADTDDLSDENFLSLLESVDNDISENNDSESNVESILLADASQDNESDDEDLSEILQLLNIEESDESESEMAEEEGSSELEKLLYETDSEIDESSNSIDSETFANLESEISKLEKVLDRKNSAIDSIHKSINKYDEQITQLESPGNHSGGTFQNNVKYASYVENNPVTPAIKNSEYSSASSFKEKYDIALSYFKNGQYQLSTSEFEKLLEEGRFHELADNCQYWIGECQFARGNYYQAIVEFEKVFSFDATDKRDDAQIMMGLTYLKMGKTDQAKDDFSWLLACYGTSEYYHIAQRYSDEL